MTTTNKAGHTKGPWKFIGIKQDFDYLENNSKSAKSHNKGIIGREDVGTICHVINIKDAVQCYIDSEFVINAVNSHDELVEACKALHDLIWPSDNGRTLEDYENAKKMFLQAIARAEGR